MYCSERGKQGGRKGSFLYKIRGGHQREQNKLKEPMSNSRGLKRPTSLEAALGLFQRSNS